MELSVVPPLPRRGPESMEGGVGDWSAGWHPGLVLRRRGAAWETKQRINRRVWAMGSRRWHPGPVLRCRCAAGPRWHALDQTDGGSTSIDGSDQKAGAKSCIAPFRASRR